MLRNHHHIPISLPLAFGTIFLLNFDVHQPETTCQPANEYKRRNRKHKAVVAGIFN
jgi:hypothetical protein